MTYISDEEMKAALGLSRSYTMVLLKKGPKSDDPGSPAIIREHGRRNLGLLKDGVLPIVCPCADTGEVRGVGIFTVDEKELRRLMDEDPGVQAGIFVYDIHPVRGFPGSALPDRAS